MQYKKTVIDSHYHIYGWQDEKGRPFWGTTDAYRTGRNFRSININALPSGSRDVSNNIIAALYKLRHPEVYIHGGLIYDVYPVPAEMPEGMDPLTQYRELMETGFDGIKMLETKPTTIKKLCRPVCDPLYRDFFDAVEEDGTHMVWHVNDPAEFWDRALAPAFCIEAGWFYGDGSYPSHEEIYRQAFAVLDRNPKLNVTFAHFFFMSGCPERLEKVFEKYPNTAVDLTPGSEMYGGFKRRISYYRDFFTRHADRIEFGTDASDEANVVEDNFWLADTVYRFVTTEEAFQLWETEGCGLNLPGEVQEKILSGNFLRRVGTQPKPVNAGALKRYIAKYSHLIRDGQVREEICRIAAEL